MRLGAKAAVRFAHRVIAAPTDTPTWAQVFVTRRCDLDCSFCTAPSNDADELTLDEWRPILERLRSWGVLGVNIVGGEPTLYRHLEGFVEIAMDLGMATILHSNLSSRNARRRVLALSDRCTAVAASIDSLDGSEPQVRPRSL